MSETRLQSTWRVISNRRMLICIGIGFASGLPLYLLLQLVPAWLRQEGASIVAIGFFTAVQLPYTIKFLWAPLLERYRFPLLGRFFGQRRSWMIGTQIGLIGLIASLGYWQPGSDFETIALIGLAIAIFSATQDIVLDAYRREILDTDGELALGNALHVPAYRISSLVPGSLGLVLADNISSELNFTVMAAFMGLGVLLTLVIDEPKNRAAAPENLVRAITLPFQEFFSRRALGPALAVLSFMALYKLGDSMATALATPFYLDQGFTMTQIGVVAKHAALWPSIIGGLLGAVIIIRIGINKALWAFGVVQLLTIFGFAWLAQLGPDLWALAAVICAEYLGVGLGTSAYLAFIARETSRLAVATQFALFTALASLPRVITSMLSGVIVAEVGWEHFFYASAVLAIPGMLLLVWVAPFNAPVVTAESNQPESRNNV